MKKKIIVLANILFYGFAFSQVGINTTVPQQTLDIEGTLRLSDISLPNKPNSSFESMPLYVNYNNGQVQYAPQGFSTTVGGYRPGNNVILKKLPVKNTLVRVSFVHYVDESNEPNDSEIAAYTYGEFTIIATDSSNPVHFVDVSIKGANGLAKPFTNHGDKITWDNGTQLTTTLSLNQVTGDLSLLDEAYTFSYFFNFLGGI